MKCAEFDVEVLVAGVLVACKSDLVQRREVSEKRGRELAASKDLHYFETSAVRTHSLYHDCVGMLSTLSPQKDHQCVEEPFLHLTSQYNQLYQQNVLALQEMTSH